MKTTSKKFWLILLVITVCLLALIPTSFVPVFVALQSKATRLYPKNITDLVNINQIFVYQVPAERRGFPFGLHCSPSSPSMLEDSQFRIMATTMNYGQIVGIMPDPVNDILLLPNSKISIHIRGRCYLFGGIELFEYPISQETFQVGEARYSQDDLDQLIHNYIDNQFPPDFFEQFPTP
jgi:hypothetical protein